MSNNLLADHCMLMKKNFMVTTGLILLCAVNAQAEDCEIPGEARHWIADYCLHQAETDDFLEQRVQACFQKHQGNKIKDTCENRKIFKLKLCQHMVSKGFYDGSAEMCFNDKEFIPTTVRNGGI